MRKTLKKCLGVAAALLVANFAVAEVKADGLFATCSPCAEVANCDPCGAVDGCGKKSGWEWGGWMEAGIYANQYGQTNAYFPGAEHNLVSASGNTALLNNVNQSDFQMNQLWLYLGKKLDTRRGFDFGGRIDAVYGTDARFTQSQGLEYTSGANRPWGDGDYYGSIAQLYGEVGYKNVSVKIGKFITPMGHEGIMATERFFYSLSYAFAELPVTHTGALATWTPNKKFSAFGGWISGEGSSRSTSVYKHANDLTFYDADNNAALFGAKYCWNKKVSLAYSALIGRENDFYVGWGDRDYFVQSVIVNVKPTKRWDYTFEWTLRNEDDGYTGDVWNWGGYGINQELIYRVNTRWAVGARFEWMHRYHSQAVNASNAYEMTFGANWTPTKWLLVRPEIRYDKVFGYDPFNVTKSNGFDARDEQFSGGVSAVVKF